MEETFIEWVDINDEMPEEEIDNLSIPVLVATKFDTVWDAVYNYNSNRWMRTFSGENLNGVTHWAHPPETPSRKKE